MVAIGALVNRPLTSLIWLGEIRDQRRRRPQGQDRRHRRHPLPGRLPEDDPRPRQALPRRRQGGQRRLRPAARAARRQRPGDARRLQQRRGRRPAPARQRPGRSPRSTSSACRPTTSWSWSPTARRWKQTRKSSASSSPPCERGTDAAVAAAGRGDQSDPRSQQRPRTETDRSRGRKRRCRCWRARTAGPALRLHGPGRVGDLRRLDARQRTDRVAAGSRANCSATPTCSGEIPE